MGILMKNGVSYSAPYAGYTKTLKEKLVAGETFVTFVDNCITDNVMVDWEVSKFGLVPTDKIEGNHSLTLVFPAQTEDVWVKATFTSTSSNSEEPNNKMVFLKATGQQYIKLPFTTNESLTFDFYTANILNQDAQLIFGENNWGMQSYMLQTVNDGFRYMPNGLDISNIGLQTNILHVECTPTYYKVNGKVSSTRTAPIGSSSSNFYFFGNSYGYNLTGSISRIKVYKLGNLVMDLLPTKVGGEACYYDLVGKKAYFSETSTPFQLEEIEYEPTPCISVGGSQQILHLPMTFSTGNENYVLKSKMYFSSAHAATAYGYSYLISAWNGRNNMIACDGRIGAFSVYPTGGRDLVSMNAIKDRWVDIEINQAQNYVKIDGVIYNNTWNNDNLQFFIQGGNTGASTPVFYGETQIYQDGVLIANYIPSVKANGIGYFYDTVSQTDKVSEGSSSFGYACF